MEGAIIHHMRLPNPDHVEYGLRLKRETDALFEKAKSDGMITDFAWYFSTQGDLNYLVVRGEIENLLALTADPRFAMVWTQVALLHPDAGWSVCLTGSSVDPAMEMLAGAGAAVAR
jgi:hypothetical protein